MTTEKQEFNLKVNQLKEKILSRHEEMRELIEKKYNLALSPIPIFFDLKGKRAGVFHYNILTVGNVRVGDSHNLKIRYNLKNLLEDEVGFILNIVTHEYCHYACHMLSKREKISFQAHGKEWKDMMVFLGVKPSRTHSYKVKPSLYFKYSCKCDAGVLVGKIIHKNMMSKNRKYLCVKCKGVLCKNMFTNESIQK